MMPLKMRVRPPHDRTPEALRHHYLTEKAIADRLRATTDREQRKQIMATMYDDLFHAVPDHPRLVRRADPERTRRANESKRHLLRRFLSPSAVVAEFGSGDCLFAADLASHARLVYAIDISDQRSQTFRSPENLSFVCYDGYSLPGVPPESVDVCFSDMLLEHLHPDDVLAHLSHVNTLLKPNGLYVFRTPHAQSGPDDVSRYFSDVAEGFHLKEWTYRELVPVLNAAGFTRVAPFWNTRRCLMALPLHYCLAVERAMAAAPAHPRRVVAKYMLPSVCCAATKRRQ